MDDYLTPVIGYEPISPAQNPGVLVGTLRLTGRVEVMRHITGNLPLNDIGLPNYIYRTDLIPAELMDEATTSEEERVDTLDVASMQLDYIEGYPSLPNGSPFWSQLPFEPIQAFKLFLEYLGVVQKEDASGRLIAPVRTMEVIADITGEPLHKVRDLSYLYYWPTRAKAHDQFMLANFQKQRETRALLVEDSQFLKAKKWADLAEKRLEAIFASEDELADMSPKEVMSMMTEMFKLQRISAGMPGAAPISQDGEMRNASLQNAIKHIAEKAGEKSFEAAEDTMTVEDMLDDPDAMEQLQDLITKTNVKSR